MTTLKKNLVIVFIQQFILLGIPFLTIPYVSRVLGPEGIGEYSYSFSIVTFFATFFLLGSNLYATRQIAKIKDNIEERSRTFSEIFYIRVLLLSIAIAAYWIACFFFFSERTVFYIQALHIIGLFVDITWLYQGLELFKRVVVRNILIKLLGFGSVFIFVKDQNDVIIYAFILGLSVVIGNLMLFYKIKDLVSFTAIPSFGKIKAHLYQMVILFAPVLASIIYSVMDKAILGSLSTIKQVGYYEQSYRIVFMITSIVNFTGVVMLSRTSALIANKRFDKLYEVIQKGLHLNFLVVLPLIFGFIVVAQPFVLLFLGPTFEFSGILCMVMAPILLFKSLGVIFGSWYFVPMNKNWEYTFPIVVGAAVNIIGNFLLIPAYGAIGAAISTVLTEGVITAIQLRYIRKVISFKPMLSAIITYVFLSASMAVFILFLGEFLQMPPFYEISVTVITGILLYTLVLLIKRDKQMLMLLNYVKRERNENN